VRSHHASVITVVSVVLAAMALAGLGAAPAGAHDHPTQAELDAPAVVFIKTFAQVNISLIEHNRHGKHIGLLQKTYEPALASGSGFAVDPTGTIVTAGGVVTPDLDKAEVFAVNEIFRERYGANAPIPKESFDKHHIKNLADDPLDSRLQRCYKPNTTDNTGGCLLSVSRLVRVYPWVSDQKKYGTLTADVLAPKEDKTEDVAVLRVGAGSMPTVALGQSASATKAFTVLGFGDVPSPKASAQMQLIGHFKAAGGPPFDNDEYLPKLEAGLRDGARGGPLVAAETGQVTGLLSLPADLTGAASKTAKPEFVDAKRIREVLTSVRVEPKRGPTDTAFEVAMHDFKNKLYTSPIPSFQRAIELYPGHALATEDLAVAKAKAGTAEDLTGKEGAGSSGSSSGGGLPGWVPVVVGVLVVLAVLAAVFLLLRRRGDRAEADGDTSAAVAKPAGASTASSTGARRSPPRALPSPPVGAAGKAAAKDGRGRDGSAPPGPAAPPAGRSGASGQRPGQTVPPAQLGAAVGAGPATPAKPSAAGKPAAEPAAAPLAWAPDEAPSFCTQCGHHLGAGHRFCGFCGKPVS
jgi:Trypsin-like peptidase domain